MTQASQRDLVLGFPLAAWETGALCPREWQKRQADSWPQEARDIMWNKSLLKTEPYMSVRCGSVVEH